MKNLVGMDATSPFVSIIIPAYNDSVRLQHCLTLLTSQSYPNDRYEVVVIDNNSTEDIKSLVASFSQAVYAFEAAPGSYSARNLGLSIAKGEILGFTDSDCAPSPDWIEKGVMQVLAHPGYGLVGGAIEFSFVNPSNPTPTELYDSLHFLRQKKYVQDDHFGVTANLFTTPDVFAAVGLFNATLKSGGDREWGQRVHAAGYRQAYAPDVVITHPARPNLKALLPKLRRVYRGDFVIKKQADLPLLKFTYQVLRNDLRLPIKHFIKILINRNIKNVGKRFLVVFIYIYVRFVKASTKVRLYIQS